MEEAYFAVDTDDDSEFVIKLTRPALIAHARKLVSGEETDRPHVMGVIKKESAPYNPSWSYHLDPDSISFFDVATEVCDASPSYVEDHLDEACGAFLPGCRWCPWSSKLKREVVFESQPASTLG